MRNLQKILFGEDKPNVLEGYKRMLRDHGEDWEQTFCSSPFEARELLRKKAFDIMVADVNMPGKNGLALLNEIKSDIGTRNVEVVIVTGERDESLKRQALNFGAADLLNKPVAKGDLIARLKSICYESLSGAFAQAKRASAGTIGSAPKSRNCQSAS